MVSRVGVYVDGENLVVPIQQDLNGDLVEQLQSDVLGHITSKRLTGLVIDLSGTSVLDTYLAGKLFDTCKMAHLMGAKAVVSGMGVGMAMSLIDLEFNPNDINTAVNLEEGLRHLRETPRPVIDEVAEDMDNVEHETDKNLAKRSTELDADEPAERPNSD